MVNINAIYVKVDLKDKSLVFTHFYLMPGKK